MQTAAKESSFKKKTQSEPAQHPNVDSAEKFFPVKHHLILHVADFPFFFFFNS